MSCSGSSRRTSAASPPAASGVTGSAGPRGRWRRRQDPRHLRPDAPRLADDNEPGYTYGPEYALPGAIMVDRAGRRFCDDSYWVSIVHNVIAPGDRHLPCFMVWDEGHHRRYGMGKTPPGGEYRNELVESGPDAARTGREARRRRRRAGAHRRAFQRRRRPRRGSRSSGAAPSRSSAPTPATPTTSPTRCWRRWPTPRTSACACTSSAPASARAASASMARVTS